MGVEEKKAKVNNVALNLGDPDTTFQLITGLLETLKHAIEGFKVIEGEIKKGKPDNAAAIARKGYKTFGRAIELLLEGATTPMTEEEAEEFIEGAGEVKH